MNLAEKLFSANAIESSLVSVKAEGFEGAFIRHLSAGERGSWEAGNVVIDGKRRRIAKDSRERLLVLCLCDSDGRRIFKDDQARDLSRLRGDRIDAVYEQCVAVNRLDPDSVEAIRKNSESEPTDDSRSV